MNEITKRRKTSLYQMARKVLVCAVVVFFVTLSHSADAGLYSPHPRAPLTPRDDEQSLDFSWGWSPEEESHDNPNLNNWKINLDIKPFLVGGEMFWDVSLTAWHLFDPHPALGEVGGGGKSTFQFWFPNAGDRAFGWLYNQEQEVHHGDGHVDRYRLVFDRSMLSKNSFFQLTGLHTEPKPNSVPEIDPAGMGSVLALVTGAMGLLERRRLRVA